MTKQIQTVKSTDWREKFNKFVKTDYCGPDVPPEYYVSENADVLMEFITKTHSTLLTELDAEVEGMKKPTKEGKGSYTDFTTSTGSRDTLMQFSYNQALSDVLEIIKSRREK